ncbi:hypothetical protein HDA41_000218 [Streptomyces caelestis]|uniref:AB hydrolase-1 domain-containing protein n=1 Tax=Streptomyces caelestis TaxID=36816 RepID=A0A7W9LQG5_9ACTN|nr:hypothetical protein [Streptomyces caelestis]
MPLGMREILPESAQRQYGLIGFDPRGVGRSCPVSCHARRHALVY